jgi:WD40 repeat protein
MKSRPSTFAIIMTVIITCQAGMRIRCAVGQELLHTISTGTWCGGIAFSEDDALLAACVSAEINKHLVAIWDVESGDEIVRMPLGRSSVREVAFAPSGKLLAVSDHFTRTGQLHVRRIDD